MVPDYYAMLGVDPRADRAAIEAALAKCQPAWSSGTRNPKTKHTYQSHLDQIPALRQALLGDPAGRAAYDAELAAVRRGERDARLDALQKRVRLRAAKGGLTVSDRKALRDEATRLGLTQDDLDRLVEPIPPRPEVPTDLDDTPDPPVDVIDPVMRRQLRVALDHLRKRDLYEALGLPRDAPAWDVADRADAERQRWMKKTQVTAEKTAWLEVVTLAQAHLTTPAARARYDRTLAVEAEEALNDAVTFTLKGLRRLDPGSRSVLLDEAAALGVEPDRAERLIARGCKALGVIREGVAPPSFASVAGPPRLLRCRSCGGVTDFAQVARSTGKAVCRHCGASLHWTCPVDQRAHWVDEPRCPCGFRVELREPLVRHFEAAQKAFRDRDYPGALAHLKRVQELAPNHAGARKGVEKVKERVTEIDRARSDFEIARAGANLVAAKAAADAWGRLVAPSTPDWRAAFTEVTRGLRDAQALLARARSVERTDPATARELYRRGAALAADLHEARAGLDRSPPSPPSNLTAEFVDGRVQLRWSPPRPDGLGPVSYVVLRKPDAMPRHPADGVRIGAAASPTFEDAGVTPGTSVAYAVLSARGEVESAGAVAVGPIFLLGEVRDVRVETRSREVDLGWSPPAGASEVRVVRKRGSPPGGPYDGDRVEAGPDQAHDRGLEPDRVYHYGIYCVYRTPDGRSTASRGVTVTAQPHTPIHPLDAPVVTPDPDGRRVALRWVEPSRGLVKIVRTDRPFPHPVGARLGPAEVAALSGDWVEVTAPDRAVDNPPPLGGCYYTPLTSWGGSATVGRSVVYSLVTDPSDLRASRSGHGQVQLRWKWGEQGTRTLVVARPGAGPTGPDDPSAIVETVDRADYARLGRYLLTLPAGGPGRWHIAVYAQATVDGRPVTSPGEEPTARTSVSGTNPDVTVSYTLSRPRLRRVWSVTFRTEPAGAPIPPTVVVTHPRSVPLSADDGTVVASFAACQDGATFPLPSGVNLKRARARIFADPRSDPEGLSPILLLHPEADATRV